MNKKVLISLFFAFIMVFSIFGIVLDYAVREAKPNLKYGGYKFKVQDQQFIATINGKERAFLFFPRDIEYMQISDDVKLLLTPPVLTVTYDPKSNISDNLGEAQYYFEVQLRDEKVIERAVTNSEGVDLPQKSCADATAVQPVIELRLSEISSIRAENNCIVVSALDPYDLYQETERLIYTMLGVMS